MRQSGGSDRRAARRARPRDLLVGAAGVLYALFVLPAPRQLSLEAGLEDEEAGRIVLESARVRAHRAGIKIHTGLIRTRNPGASLVEEAVRVGADAICWSTLHAPAGERGIGPTAVHLLSRRPCRVIVETERRPERAPPDGPRLSGARAQRCLAVRNRVARVSRGRLIWPSRARDAAA